MEAMGRLLVTLVAPVFVLVGLHCGIIMPDIDQRTNLLLHRSIITHSPLIPLILLFLALRIGLGLYAFAMGVSIGFAVHHAFDLFPKGWTGAALISIPFYDYGHRGYSHGYGLRLARLLARTLQLGWCKGGWIDCGICSDLSIFLY